MSTAVYPGSFDPVTLGHTDIIERAAALFDEVVVAVLINSAKHPVFTLDERVQLIRKATAHLQNVRVESFEGLLVDFAKRVHAEVIVKGLRSPADFDNEFQMAFINASLSPDVDTIFLPTRHNLIHVSSTVVKEVARCHGSLDGLLPAAVREEVEQRLSNLSRTE